MAKKNSQIAKRNGSPPVRLDSGPNTPTADPLVSDGKRTPRAYRQFSLESYSGPIPPPQLLAEYDKIVPGSAKEIIGMATAQSAHRRDLERYNLLSEARRSNWGLAAAFTAFLSCVGVAYRLAMTGHDWLAAAFVATPVLGAVTTFIYGTNSRRSERIQKTAMMIGQAEDEGEPGEE